MSTSVIIWERKSETEEHNARRLTRDWDGSGHPPDGNGPRPPGTRTTQPTRKKMGKGREGGQVGWEGIIMIQEYIHIFSLPRKINIRKTQTLHTNTQVRGDVWLVRLRILTRNVQTRLRSLLTWHKSSTTGQLYDPSKATVRGISWYRQSKVQVKSKSIYI